MPPVVGRGRGFVDIGFSVPMITGDAMGVAETTSSSNAEPFLDLVIFECIRLIAPNVSAPAAMKVSRMPEQIIRKHGLNGRIGHCFLSRWPIK